MVTEKENSKRYRRGTRLGMPKNKLASKREGTVGTKEKKRLGGGSKKEILFIERIIWGTGRKA